MSAHLLDVRNLWVRFNRDGEVVNAVDDVSFHVDPGETLVILGESGSGKSVSTMSILDLVEAPPAEISRNSIFYAGEDMSTMSRAQRRSINGRRISIIFQDPLSHLNPVYSVGWQIGEVFRAHRKEVRETDIHGRTIELLERVGLPDPPAQRAALSARILRRPAPAHHDRHGLGAAARHPDRRRADHRARRHRAGRDTGARSSASRPRTAWR